MPAITTIQLRQGTALAWTTANPILAAGETGWETDTGKRKVGDGTTHWTSLVYTDATYAHLAGTETITGAKTLTGATTVSDKTSATNVALRAAVSTFYVDPVNGNDSNDGLSIGSAWATIAHAIGSNRHIHLLPGQHQLSGAVAIASQNYLTIEGAGTQITDVVVNGNYDGFTISGAWTQITIKNLDVVSFANRTSGYAINAQGTSGTHSDHLTVENVSAYDTFGGFFFKYVDISHFHNLEYVQSVSGASGTDMCTFFSCISTRVANLSETVTAGTITGNCLLVDSDCDTFDATGIEVGDCADNGILIQNSLGTGHTGPRLVRITDFWVESCTLAGIAVTSGHDIKLTNGESALNGTDGYVIKGNGGGGGDEGVIGFTAVNCYAALNNQHGFHVSSNNGTPMAFVGCTSICNSQQTNLTYNQFQIDNSVTNVTIHGGTAGNYYYTITNSASYGISIGATSTDYITVAGVDCSNNTTGGIHNLSTGTHNQLYGNKGVTAGETFSVNGVALQQSSVQVVNTSGTVTPPAWATMARIEAVGGGAGGGGGGSAALTSGVTGQSGGAGGAAGMTQRGVFTVSSANPLTVTVGAGSAGAAGGAASTNTVGHAGTASSTGSSTTVTGTGVSLTALGGGSTTVVAAGNNITAAAIGGYPGGTANSPAGEFASIPGTGGLTGGSTFGGPNTGGSQLDMAGGGGAGGYYASATLGGKGGGAGTLTAPGPVNTGQQASGTAGGTGASAAANTGAGGGGGGGGAPGGAGGTGGAGGSGYVVITWFSA